MQSAPRSVTDALELILDLVYREPRQESLQVATGLTVSPHAGRGYGATRFAHCKPIEY